MTRNAKLIVLIAGILAAILFVFLALRRTGPVPIALPAAVGTVAEGYELILPLKNQIAYDSQLLTAIVELEPGGDQLQVSKIVFAFVPKRENGENVRVITVDNNTRTAYFAAEFPESSTVPAGVERSHVPIDVGPISMDVPDVLAAAKDKGLEEFCALVPKEDQQIKLRLTSAQGGPVWRVFGDGGLDPSSAATLLVDVDARTGKVVRQKLEKGASNANTTTNDADAH